MRHSEKMINLSKCNSRGFTLIELVLTVIAIGIFGAITANILGNASKVYDATLKKQKFVFLPNNKSETEKGNLFLANSSN